MENFDLRGNQIRENLKEKSTESAKENSDELNMSVSPICRGEDGKQYAYVSFTDKKRSAEGKIPECKITSNKGFEEGEVLQLEIYMKQQLDQLKKMAASVNVATAFMKDKD